MFTIVTVVILKMFGTVVVFTLCMGLHNLNIDLSYHLIAPFRYLAYIMAMGLQDKEDNLCMHRLYRNTLVVPEYKSQKNVVARQWY